MLCANVDGSPGMVLTAPGWGAHQEDFREYLARSEFFGDQLGLAGNAAKCRNNMDCAPSRLAASFMQCHASAADGSNLCSLQDGESSAMTSEEVSGNMGKFRSVITSYEMPNRFHMAYTSSLKTCRTINTPYGMSCNVYVRK